MPTQEKFASIRKGLLEFLVLRLVASDKMYVADMLQRLSTTEFATQEGTLYPLLTRLKNAGLLSYRWEESPSGPPRKYYSLTPLGEKFLDELRVTWNELVEAVNETTKLKISE